MIRHNYRPHVNRVHVNWAKLEGTIAARSAPVLDAAPAPVAAPEPWSPEPLDYSTWLKADLVALADERGLDSSGTKAEIIERLSDE